MFCKYCGGDLAAGDMKCKRCGREVAARSDCGGFYDLVADEKPTAPSIVVSAPKAKTPVALITVMAAGFAVLLALVIVLFAMQTGLTRELEDLRSEIKDLTSESAAEETITDGEQTNSSEELTITLPDLFGQDAEKEEEITESPTESEV